jgi:hypothetical protein
MVKYAVNTIIITYDNNQHLSINLGPKVMVDKLSLNGFTLNSIAVYGKDYEYSPLNTYAGHISFEALWGRPSYPIFYLPLVMLVGVGGLLIVLLVFKKGNSS